MKHKDNENFKKTEDLITEGIMMALYGRVKEADKKYNESYIKLEKREIDITELINAWDDLCKKETSLVIFTQYSQKKSDAAPKILN